MIEYPKEIQFKKRTFVGLKFVRKVLNLQKFVIRFSFDRLFSNRKTHESR